MKNTCKLIVAALILGASAGMTVAQPPDGPPPDGQRPPPEGGPGRHGHRPPPLPIVMALDTNHDGIIDADEIANAPAALKTLDKNGDGQLTADEYLPPRPSGRGGPPLEGAGPQGPGGGTNHPPVPPIVAALDLNGDGIIDSNEIAQASESLKKLDKNGDGQLTPDEYRPPHPSGPGGPGRRELGQGPGQAGDQGYPPGPGGPQPPDAQDSARTAPPGDQP